MTTSRTLMTADELLDMTDDGQRHELVRGELRTMPPAGSEHALINTKVAIAFGQFVDANSLGVVLSGDPGFKISSNPDTVRAPDVAFVRKERVPESGVPREFWPGAPDLAIEIISPSDRYTEVVEKANDWLDAGTRMVILIDPRTRTVTVYSSLREATQLTESGVLTCGDVVPGFEYPVAELFK